VTKASTTPETTTAALEAAWERSDHLFGLLAPRALLARPIALRQPFLFYVGHLPAFAWNQLWRGALGRRPFAPELDTLFQRGIDPPDDGGAAADEQAWPSPESVLAYRDRIRDGLREVLDEEPVQAVLPMVLEHELMHHETLLYMVHQLDRALKARPERWPAPPAGLPRERTRVRVPGGRVVLGAARDGTFRWDNEHPEHAVDVNAFSIDAVPVTNRDFREFVEAGGYQDERLWSGDGWEWITRRGHDAPRFWTGRGDETRVATLFEDVPFEAAAGWPASVMHCEAEAYARWAGGRLPTEAEVHRAAFGTPDGHVREHPWGDAAPGAEHGNFGFRLWSPGPVGAHPAGASAFGVHELVGNGWEWTSTAFAPFPGFAPMPRYPGYSADFFDGRHFVMLGASWATDDALVRRSFRNWFQPHYPYVFSKFRCAYEG
jgi:ergothioneine biosynthesis protein EgtB